MEKSAGKPQAASRKSQDSSCKCRLGLEWSLVKQDSPSP